MNIITRNGVGFAVIIFFGIISQLTKYWIVNYAFIVICFCLCFGHIKINTGVLYYSFALSLTMILMYLYVGNQTLLKYSISLFILPFLIGLLNELLFENKYLNTIIDCIFYFLCIFNLLCFIFPLFNDYARMLFSYADGSSFRISGLIQAYEFVPYVLLTYVTYKFIANNFVISKLLLFNSLIAIFVSLISGRFAIVLIMIFLFYIFKSLKNKFMVIILMFMGASTVYMVKPDIYRNLYLAFSIGIELLKNFNFEYIHIEESKYVGEIEVEGQYNLSPVTWLNELILPLSSISDHIFPSKEFTQIDPGPSYLILNLGILYFGILYYMYFFIIKKMTSKSIPLIIIILLLFVDLKYKALYSLMPLVWIVTLHINYIKTSKFHK